MKKYSKILVFAFLGILGVFLFLKLSFYPPILLYRLCEFKRESFLSQLKFIRENNFRIVSLEELALNPKIKRNPKLLAIVFEGLDDNLKELFKIAEEFRIPLTLFINKESFIKKSQDLKQLLKSSYLELGLLSKKNLGKLSYFSLEKEIFLPKSLIESILEKKVKYIMFSSGKHTPRVLKAIENNGYLCGITLDKSLRVNKFSLKPIRVSFKDSPKILRKKLSGFYYLLER